MPFFSFFFPGFIHTLILGSPPGQLILPESLKLWPLLTLGALKSVALRENSKLGSSASLSRLDGGSVGSRLDGGSVGPDPRADERACALAELYGGRGVRGVGGMKEGEREREQTS